MKGIIKKALEEALPYIQKRGELLSLLEDFSKDVSYLEDLEVRLRKSDPILATDLRILLTYMKKVL